MTAKSRYLASIDRGEQKYRKESRSTSATTYNLSNAHAALDDPPPPPPNPPAKRAGAGTGGHKLSTYSSSSYRNNRNSFSSDHPIIEEDRELPSHISLNSYGDYSSSSSKNNNSSRDFNNDNNMWTSISTSTLEEDNSQGENSSNFSYPVLSVSSNDKSGTYRRSAAAAAAAASNKPKRNSNTHSSSRPKSTHSVQSENSLSTLGFSQVSSTISPPPPPPPPPPGTPPNAKHRPLSSSSSSNKSGGNKSKGGRSVYSTSSNRHNNNNNGRTAGSGSGSISGSISSSTKKVEYRSSEFGNIDFDLGELKNNDTTTTTTSNDVMLSPESNNNNNNRRRKSMSTTASSERDHHHHVSDTIFDEEESVQTEVLRYGEVNKNKDSSTTSTTTPNQEMNSIPEEFHPSTPTEYSVRGNGGSESESAVDSTSEKKMSVAEKRRRKAMANYSSTPNSSASSKAISRASSKDTQRISNVRKKTKEEEEEDMRRKQVGGKDRHYLQNNHNADVADPPLVLYDSDDYYNEDTEEEGEDKAIRKKKKKTGALFKMKSFLRGNKSPCKGRDDTVKKTGRLSPFRKRSSSKERSSSQQQQQRTAGIKVKKSDKLSSRQTKEAPKPEKMEKTEAPKPEKVDSRRKTIPLKKQDSDLSYDAPPTRSLERLESGLSFMSERDYNNEKTSKAETGRLSEMKKAQSHRENKETHTTKQDRKTGQRAQRSQYGELSKAPSQGPSEISMGGVDVDDFVQSEDEVSAMTNPTFASQSEQDPVEKKRSVYRSGAENSGSEDVARANSAKSLRSDPSTATPLISNQLKVLPEHDEDEHVRGTEYDDVDEEINDPEPIMDDEDNDEEDIVKDREAELEDEFFDGLNWGNGGQDHNQFFLIASSSNEHSSASKDPFGEPFYHDVTSVVSKESENKQSYKSSFGREFDEVSKESNDQVLKVKGLELSVSKGSYSSIGNTSADIKAVEKRNISPLRVDVRKIKAHRRKHSQSPMKSRSLQRSIVSDRQLTDNISGGDNSSTYHKSPGISIQSRDLRNNDNTFLGGIKRDEEVRSPALARAPSFLEKRRNRDKQEEYIRAKLDKQQEDIRAKRENEKRRMEAVTKRVEAGKRKDNIIDLASAQQSSSKTSVYVRNRSPEKDRNNSNGRRVSISLSDSRSISRGKRKIFINTTKTPGVFQGSIGLVDGPNGIENSKGGLKPTNFSDDSSEQSSVARKAFKAPEVFHRRDSKKIKPFKAPESFTNHEIVPSLSVDISDPIQRAGIRLLSAAAIPIQTEIRRYLGKKAAEDRMWAIIVMQSYFRRWKAELMMYKYLFCATRIQAAFRGWLVRDTLDHKHYCATQIQRISRGYLATMRVYESLYNITVVQSIVRRNAAIKVAEKRFNSIVLIQSVYRRYAQRRKLEHLHKKATVIQTAWRGFTAQLNYQFDIVDIIIVQSIVRKRACQKRYAAMLFQKQTEAAIVIQKYWRGYDCTMNYLHSIADILIVQSVVRRRIAMRYVQKYRDKLHNRSALAIQRTWRGFKQYVDYMFTISEIIVVQKTVRVWLAKRNFEKLKIQKKEEQVYNAAVTIQKVWRGHQAQIDMLFTLVHIIIAQSVIRRRIAIVKFKPMRMEHRAAVTLQCVWRVKLAKRRVIKEVAARKIQATVRGCFAYSSFVAYKAARKIQSWYRSKATRRGYVYYISARKIQTAWRGYDARKLVEEERWIREYAATMIQKNWRMIKQREIYMQTMMLEKAATAIQSQWRCFWAYSHFVISRYEAVRIQAAFRGYQTRRRLNLENYKATVIQSAARMLLAKRFCHMERLYNAVVFSAQISLQYKNSAKKLQRRYKNMHYTIEEKKAALVIERFFIWVRNEVEREIARREKMKMLKKQKQRSKRAVESVHQDHILNDVWDETIQGVSKGKLASPNQSRHVSPSRFHMQNSSYSRRKQLSKAPSSPLVNRKVAHDFDNRPSPMKMASDPGMVALDFDDESSNVSGLTTPSITPRYVNNNNKQAHAIVDDQIDEAWARSKKHLSTRSGLGASPFHTRPIIEEEDNEQQYKENSFYSVMRETNSPIRARRYSRTSPAR